MEKLPIGTVVYLDGITCHLGMVMDYGHDDNYDEDTYVMASVSIDGQLELNPMDENSDDFIYPVEICEQASETDTHRYARKLSEKLCHGLNRKEYHYHIEERGYFDTVTVTGWALTKKGVQLIFAGYYYSVIIPLIAAQELAQNGSVRCEGWQRGSDKQITVQLKIKK